MSPRDDSADLLHCDEASVRRTSSSHIHQIFENSMTERSGGSPAVRREATVPLDFSHLSAHQFATKIVKLLDEHEAQELEKLADQGRELLGRGDGG